jgi:peptide/nickel transport system substrate-binding protein
MMIFKKIKKHIIWGLPLALILVVSVSSFSAKRGGTLTVAIPNDPESLFAVNSVTAVDYSVIRHVTDHLIEFDKDFNIVPRLAEKWHWEDNKTLVMNLRQGVKFTDGAAWNAESAKINLDFFRTGRFKRTDMLKFVERVDIADPYAIRIKLSQPYTPFLNNLAFAGMQMVSPLQIKSISPAEIGNRPIGTGPYILKEYIQGERIVLERNKGYWEEGLPYFDKLIFRIVPDRSVRTMMLLGGEVDLVWGLSPLDVDAVKAGKGLEVISEPSVTMVYIGLNQLRPIFRNPKVGKALNHAIDRKTLVNTILKGHVTPLDSIVPPGVFGYSSVYVYPYDPEKAKKLLAEAGYPNGFDMVLAVPRGRYLMDYEIGEYLQAAWGKIGVRCKLITWEWGTYISAISREPGKREEDAFMITVGARTGHADFISSVLFHSSNWSPKGSNRFFYKDPEADKLIDEAVTVVDPNKARALYKRLQEKIVLEDCPWIFLHVENNLCGKKVGLHGMEMLRDEQYILRKASLER